MSHLSGLVDNPQQPQSSGVASVNSNCKIFSYRVKIDNGEIVLMDWAYFISPQCKGIKSRQHQIRKLERRIKKYHGDNFVEWY